MKVFKTFECSVKICQIPSAIFQTTSQFYLQIFHHSSVSCKIIPLYFFRLNVIYFEQKEPLTKFLSYLKQKISFSSNFVSLFSVMRYKSSILLLADILYTFNKGSLSKYKFGEISCEQWKV